MQIIKSTVWRGKNYEIGNSISMGTAQIILNMPELRSKYVVVEKKIEKNCLSHGFSIQTREYLSFLVIDKDSLTLTINYMQ